MLKTLRIVASIACLLSLTSIGRSQALPVATAEGRSQVGFLVTYARPDFWVAPIGDPQYSRQFILGVSGYGDYTFNDRVSLEGEFHCICLITALDRAELTYLVGPRITYPIRRFNPYIKGMIGFRDLFIQEWQDNVGIPGGMGSAYVVGAGVDYQYSQKYVIRALDIEIQKWPTYSTYGITPIVISTGFAWRFH
jgi:hypothetical protein